MKKKLLMAVLLAGVLAVTGCSDKKDTPKKDEQNQNTTEEQKDGDVTEQTEKLTSKILADINIEKAVTLGEYKGLEVEKVIPPVMEEEIDNKIKIDLQDYPVEVTGRAAEDGDVVNIDYVGRVDGKEFEGGSAKDTDLTLGSGQFIEGFEAGLIGAQIGDTKVLNLTFPQEYAEELSGKDVEFTVTVNGIKRPLEEPTDEWVKENLEGYSNVEEYRQFLMESMEEDNRISAEEQLRYTAFQQIVEASTINEYPDELVEMGKEMYIQQAELYAMYGGMELKDLVASYNITMEEFEKNAGEFGKDIAAQSMVSNAICKKENYAIGDDAYQEALKKMMEDYQVTSEEELFQRYGQENVEQTIMLNRVTDVILENAKITEVSHSTTELEPVEGYEGNGLKEDTKEE